MLAILTAPTWADRSLPLAERVVRLVNVGSTLSGAEYAAARDALLADVAAADRLARADARRVDTLDTWHFGGHPQKRATVETLDAAAVEYNQALEAYRARMAQGATHGT